VQELMCGSSADLFFPIDKMIVVNRIRCTAYVCHFLLCEIQIVLLANRSRAIGIKVIANDERTKRTRFPGLFGIIGKVRLPDPYLDHLRGDALGGPSLVRLAHSVDTASVPTQGNS